MVIANADRRKFSQQILNKALSCMERQKPVKLKHHRYEHERVIFKIEVGYSHRLISSDLEVWVLYTHETYSSYLFR